MIGPAKYEQLLFLRKALFSLCLNLSNHLRIEYLRDFRKITAISDRLYLYGSYCDYNLLWSDMPFLYVIPSVRSR